MLTSEILDKAADVIERNGWHRGGFIQITPGVAPAASPCCAMAAINIAEGDDPYVGLIYPAHEAMANHLALDVSEWDPHEESYPLGQWNDLVAETAEQVIAELRAAAASEREAGR
jgi:hypothetical protein